ncbi:glycosyltransferase family 2 protein [Sulfurospirillum sp. MES]|uniref:glycosyltransferase family 2 protein n=1 Tax=Sulfurospirillum sp. MES TaxID=1565314 RepID=UPI000544159D|nr:glycosyltransferase family 2 protein [Sulfurospirillum sp. MES]KHG33795.1 MAG: alpha-L-Rha alpha-1,3-L-rhamnosyltransferase [Sulfurospirillum sp. MES]
MIINISVCIATWNGQKYIKEQLDSILSQLSEYDEVVISDDSSTDKTVEIIKSYNDKRIKILENQNFKSPIFNFENALKYADGKIIILADQDDVWKKNKIEKIKEYMQNYDLVLSDADIIDKNSSIVKESFYEINNSKSGFFKNLMKNSFLGCTMAFNQKILEKSLPFPKDLPMHDWWIGLIGEIYGKTYFIEDKLISYRRHGGNISSAGEKSKYSIKQKIFFRFIMIKNLIQKYLANLLKERDNWLNE